MQLVTPKLEDSKIFKEFMASLHTERTKSAYEKEIRLFMEHEKVKDIGTLIKLPDSQQRIIDYLIELKSDGYSYSSLNLTKSAILKLYTECSDINLIHKRISSKIGRRTYVNADEPYTVSEIQEMVKFAGNIRNVAIILFLSSVGCRIGAMGNMKKGDLIPVQNGTMYRVNIYPGTDDAYFTFLTEEATKAINDYLALRQRQGETIIDNSVLWRTEFDISKPNQNIRAMKYSSIKSEIRKIRFKSAVAQRQKRIKRGQRFESPTRVSMGFRKFVYNNMLSAGLDIEPREWMMGHSLPSPRGNYMKQCYHQDRNLKEYLKVQDLLIISNEQRNEQLLQKQTTDIQVQLRQEKLRREQAEQRLAKLEERMELAEAGEVAGTQRWNEFLGGLMKTGLLPKNDKTTEYVNKFWEDEEQKWPKRMEHVKKTLKKWKEEKKLGGKR